MSSPSTPAKRACDSCHRRKVRCIGEGTNPCKNCISAGLTCTYNAIPQKKGPKGSRAKVLSELRETQRQSQILTGYPDELGFDGRPVSSAFIRTPGLLPPGLVESCVEFFFGNLYPSQPILHRQRIQDTIMSMEHSTEAYCMIVALCACVMTQSNMSVPPNVALHGDVGQISNVGLGAVLLEESIRVRRGHDYIENPTLLSAITSFFYFGSYFGLDKDNTAWFHLREATTLAQLMGMHDEETYKTGDAIDCSRMRRLYWLLFVTERTHALHKHRPLTLHATIHPPNIDEDISERPHMTGFLQIVNLYKPFDDTFISLWNKVRTNCSPAWLAQLQNQLSDALPTYLECTEIQAADLKTSQHWLRMMVWQLCVSQGFVSSMATDNAMTFKYPIEISRDLLAVTHQFSQQAMEVHGVGLVEKLFDIACCLTDVIACIPFSPSTFSLGPRDYLSRFLTLISTLHGGQSRYLPLLLSKISDVLPNLSLPPSLNLPQAHSNMGLSPSMTPSLTLGSNASANTPTNPNAESELPPSHILPSAGSTTYSTDLMRQLQSQQQSLSPASASLLPPTSRVEDLSLYSTPSAPHSSHSASAPPSHEATPGPYESSPGSTIGHPTDTHNRNSLSHAHMAGAAGYDLSPQIQFQTFGVGAAMGFQDEEGAQAPVVQSTYTQAMENQRHQQQQQQQQQQGGLGHGRQGLGGGPRHGGGYA